MPLKYQYSYSAQTATRSTLHQLLCISEAQLLFLQATTFETQDVLPIAQSPIPIHAKTISIAIYCSKVNASAFLFFILALFFLVIYESSQRVISRNTPIIISKPNACSTRSNKHTQRSRTLQISNLTFLR